VWDLKREEFVYVVTDALLHAGRSLLEEPRCVCIVCLTRSLLTGNKRSERLAVAKSFVAFYTAKVAGDEQSVTYCCSHGYFVQAQGLIP
jgi:hypothetical protein